MNPYPLIITIGLFVLLMGVVGANLFKTSSASLASKLVVPSLLTALACFLWYTIPNIFGYPIETTMAALPEKAELVAFVPYENEKSVDLWLRQGKSDPRAYRVPLDEELKSTLRKARQQLAQGMPTEVGKKRQNGRKRPHEYGGMDGGQAPYELLPNAFNLPQKE